MTTQQTAPPVAEGTHPDDRLPGAPDAPAWPQPPDADLVLPGNATEAAWHRTRAMGIGGSEALAVLGLSQWQTPYELYLRKIGELPPSPAKGRQRWGHRMEPVVTAWFTEETGLRVRRKVGTWRHRTPLVPGESPGPRWALCNPDGFVEDGAGFEAKTVASYSPDARQWAEEIPDYPESQAQWCMGVTGLHRWYVVGQLDGEPEPRIHLAYRNPAVIRHLFDAAAEFLAEHVLAHVPPPIDGRKSSGKAHDAAVLLNGGTAGMIEGGERLAELLAERRRLKEIVAAARLVDKHELPVVDNAIRELLGNHEYGLVDGQPVVRYRQCHRAGYTVKATDYMELREVTSGGKGA